MSETLNKLNKISEHAIELANLLAKRKKTVLALQLIEELYRDISEKRKQQYDREDDQDYQRIEDRLLRKFNALKITGKQKNSLQIYRQTFVQAIIVIAVMSICFLFGGYVATAYLKRQANEVSAFIKQQQELKYVDRETLAMANLRRALLFDPQNETYSSKLAEIKHTIECSDGWYGAYVWQYADLLSAYEASGGRASIGEWGKAHYDGSGKAEGRTLPINYCTTGSGDITGSGGTVDTTNN